MTATTRDFLQSQADTRAMRKQEAKWHRLDLKTGEDLEDMLRRLAIKPGPHICARLLEARRHMKEALRAERGAEDGLRGCEEREASMERWAQVHTYLMACRNAVRRWEKEMADLRGESEVLSRAQGFCVSEGWPPEET